MPVDVTEPDNRKGQTTKGFVAKHAAPKSGEFDHRDGDSQKLQPMDAKYVRDSKHYVPEALRRVCDDIRAQLATATRQSGPIGEATKRLRELLLAHLDALEESAFPACAALQNLVSGDMHPEMAQILPVINRFSLSHDGLIKEHRSIVSSIEALWEAAYEEGNGEIAAFAHNLLSYKSIEEEVLYPVVLLIGEYLKHKAPVTHSEV